MMTPRRMVTIVGAVALTLAIAVTAVAAGGPLRGLAAPSTTGATVGNEPNAGSGAVTAFELSAIATVPDTFTFVTGPVPDGDFAAHCQDFLNNLTANLGVTVDQFQAAMKKTLIQQIDAAQAAGNLTAEQAQAARDRINSSDAPTFCVGVGAAVGSAGGPRGGGPEIAVAGGILHGDMLNAAATYFNITPDQFRQDLKDAGSLQGVAAKYGMDNDAGKAGLLAALEAALRQELTDHGLSADQINQIVEGFKQHFDMLYTAPIGKFGPGGSDGPSWTHVLPGSGPGTRGPRATPSASPAPVVR